MGELFWSNIVVIFQAFYGSKAYHQMIFQTWIRYWSILVLKEGTIHKKSLTVWFKTKEMIIMIKSSYEFRLRN